MSSEHLILGESALPAEDWKEGMKGTAARLEDEEGCGGRAAKETTIFLKPAPIVDRWRRFPT